VSNQQPPDNAWLSWLPGWIAAAATGIASVWNSAKFQAKTDSALIEHSRRLDAHDEVLSEIAKKQDRTIEIASETNGIVKVILQDRQR
jgi:hypothetical protein